MENNILRTIMPVVENSGFVSIDHNKIREFKEDFSRDDMQGWIDNTPFDRSLLTDGQILNFLFTFNALSFSYWGDPKWTVKYGGRKYDGSYGMITSLGRAIRQGVDFNPRYLANIQREELEEILRGNIKIPLFEERLQFLNDLGRITLKRYGSFGNLVNEANRDSIKLLNILVNSFPLFYDSAFYNERGVFFHKRAQLLVSDISYVFREREYGDLDNVDKLTACADYKIPQILRRLGILRYREDLESKIDDKIEIENGSKEEVEIRANTVWAVELMKIPGVTAMEIDNYLWLVGQNKSLDDKHYHLTRTTDY